MKLVQKITSLFLIVIFLVSSLGFTINKMVCTKSGKTRLSLVQMKDCCSERSASVPTIKSSCCDITNTSFSLGNFQNTQKCEINAVHPVSCINFNKPFTLHSGSLKNAVTFFFTDLPSPLHGRLLLHFISILII